jgi:hypothetical protein
VPRDQKEIRRILPDTEKIRQRFGVILPAKD